MPQAPRALEIPGLESSLHLYLHDERDRHVSKRLREEGIWEPYETQLLLQLLGPGQVFVDAGANIGYFSVLAADRVGPGGKVYAFEPAPENFALLRRNLESNGMSARAELICAGLASANDRARLYLNESNLGDHQVHPDEPGRDSIEIELLRGADYLAGRCEQIDVLKVDTQGAEYAVLSGLMPLLLKQRTPCQALIELTPFSLRQAGASGRELIGLLAQLQQPLWIVDHIEHRLVASSAEELATWCDHVDAVADDRGFMNILVGPGIPD